jgi:SAM-dependent methyltransferase
MLLPENKSIDAWLNLLRQQVTKKAPELVSIFETYAAEAKFGRAFINENLKNIDDGSCILEVGGGAMILSCQLVLEGFEVVAVEPTGEGFSHFHRLRELILEQARIRGCMPQILLINAESLSLKNQFDFAFSINVMEHVIDIKKVVDNVYFSLKKAASYRFTCPNYLFPYEPHFNIPIIWNKKITSILLHRAIFNNKSLPDPLGTWSSLNWISVPKLNKIAKENKNIRMKLNKNLTSRTIARVSTDVAFASRRSGWMRMILIFIVKIKCHQILNYLPAEVQPIIDCEIISLGS